MEPLEIPSAAKAGLQNVPFAAGLKSRPFKADGFSAASEARPLQNKTYCTVARGRIFCAAGAGEATIRLRHLPAKGTR
jgi:hypothetical protein